MKKFVIAAALMAILLLWATRNQVMGEERVIYIVNRYTGTVTLCAPSECKRLPLIEPEIPARIEKNPYDQFDAQH